MPTVGRTISASAQDGWDILVDLDAWPRWGPTVRRAELDHPSPLALGSTGRVWTPVGIAVPFVITEFDAGRSWSWAVAGVPATAHRVEPRGDRLSDHVPGAALGAGISAGPRGSASTY